MPGRFAVGLIILIAACSGVTPGTPERGSVNDIRPGPGVFTGPTGEAVLFERDADALEAR